MCAMDIGASFGIPRALAFSTSPTLRYSLIVVPLPEVILVGVRVTPLAISLRRWAVSLFLPWIYRFILLSRSSLCLWAFGPFHIIPGSWIIRFPKGVYFQFEAKLLVSVWLTSWAAFLPYRAFEASSLRISGMIGIFLIWRLTSLFARSTIPFSSFEENNGIVCWHGVEFLIKPRIQCLVHELGAIIRHYLEWRSKAAWWCRVACRGGGRWDILRRV